MAPASREQGAGDGGGPSRPVGVVDQQHHAGRHRDVVADPHARQQRLRPCARRRVDRRRGTVDAERVDERQPAHRGDVGGERRDAARVPARGHRHDRDRAFPGPRPPAQHLDDAGGHVGRHLAVGTIEERDGVAPRGVVGEGEGASLAAADDPTAATVEARRPQLARFDAPRRGRAGTPGRRRRCCSWAGRRVPAARRCTPSTVRTAPGRGRRAPPGGTPSGSRRRRRSGASGRPRPPAPAPATATSPRRTPTACRWAASRPGRARPRRRRRGS